VANGATIGVLVGLDSGRARRLPSISHGFSDAFARLLEPAAYTLLTALRVARAEALSVTDDLTQLYNSRYLNEVLRKETKRAMRSDWPLSLLFVDLDGFKAINDEHGHLLGSRALIEAADVIRASARETDIVARFGGDEFAILLPETGVEGAHSVARRLRERLQRFTFLAGVAPASRVTGSIGVATLPDAADTAEGLLQAADAAMYRVKVSGKNGIHIAGSEASSVRMPAGEQEIS
jgi:diguanylate cyclase (GGDEF)-like protein